MKLYNISAINMSNDSIHIIIDGEPYKFKYTDISPKLAKASKAERENIKISPSGYGISWPLINENLSINGLLGARQSPINIQNNLHI